MAGVRAPIAVVVNPRSGRHRADPALTGRLRALLDTRDLFAAVEDHAALRDVAVEARARGSAIVAVSGGDGTLGLAVGALEQAWAGEPLPPLVPLRGGTMNTIAHATGVPRGRPEALLAALVRALERGQPLRTTRRRTMDVAGRRCFLFGMGIGRAFLEEYYGRGRARPSPLVAARTLAAIAGSALVRGPLIASLARRVDLTVYVDGARWVAAPLLTLLAGTIDQIGLGFRPFFRAGDGIDAFHVVAVHGSPAAVVAGLPRVRLGLPLPPTVASETLARSVLVELAASDLAEYFADGDLERADAPLHIALGPTVRIGSPPDVD
ncbi:MAG: diacylglycerol kinase [Myxococcota bacterium]|nr:diacylglycerol kinase [Myxococcota bacterium]MDW8363574.1 diacylglycerol kinase family protein [Myxococcales bacterium]